MKQLLILTFVLSSLTSKAQINADTWSFSIARKTAITNTRLTNSTLYGLEAEYMATDKIGLNYTVYGGKGIFHMPGGVAVGTIVLAGVASLGGEFDAEILMYAFAIPEGVTFNLKIAERLYFSPYINPLGLEIASSYDRATECYMTGATGLKLKAFIPNGNIWMNGDEFNFFFNGFVEAQLAYREHQEVGARAGISLGVAF